MSCVVGMDLFSDSNHRLSFAFTLRGNYDDSRTSLHSQKSMFFHSEHSIMRVIFISSTDCDAKQQILFHLPSSCFYRNVIPLIQEYQES